MGYEDIEPPTSEVDKLYKAIVADYKAGKYSSKEEALSILESQYFFSFIEIKEKIRFEGYSFFLHGKLPNIDEYIKVCEKSEISPSSIERDANAQRIDEIIKNYQVASEEGGDAELVLSYSEAAAVVYREVDKVREFCRKNRETKELYEKYKAEIETLPDIPIKRKKCTPEEIIQILLDYIPPKIKKGEPKTIRDKVFPGGYLITTSVPDVRSFLEEKQKSGEIAIDDIPGFMKVYLKGKKGKDVARSFITEKSINRNKQ